MVGKPWSPNKLYGFASQSEFKDLPSFIFGQSMGGPVALKVHLKQPLAWDGTILVAPMCKVTFMAHL